ncbi:MAG: hypothetical protein JWL69_5149, partial [Phycisphaerales bacterium]|nr:hypothetical protein [Phycisphaerales bacterium]
MWCARLGDAVVLPGGEVHRRLDRAAFDLAAGDGCGAGGGEAGLGLVESAEGFAGDVAEPVGELGAGDVV